MSSILAVWAILLSCTDTSVRSGPDGSGPSGDAGTALPDDGGGAGDAGGETGSDDDGGADSGGIGPGTRPGGPEAFPFAFCQDKGEGLKHLTMASFHGRAWFWKPPPRLQDEDPGFMLAIQAASEPGDVCPEPHSWGWYDDPAEHAVYLVMTWVMPSADPASYVGVHEWSPDIQYSIGRAPEGFAMYLGTREFRFGHTGILMNWWAPMATSSDDDRAWLCVTEFTREHIRARLAVQPVNTSEDWLDPGFLIDLDLRVDAEPDDDPCFEMKSTISDAELWGE